jgi:hypothetical protein
MVVLQDSVRVFGESIRVFDGASRDGTQKKTMDPTTHWNEFPLGFRLDDLFP